jgi:dolichyl-phosphate-mannose--protein O-mannosyl transferase
MVLPFTLSTEESKSSQVRGPSSRLPRVSSAQHVRALLEQARDLAVTPFGAMVAALLALGAYLRLHAFDVPATFMFDEHHFVENARNYLSHRVDDNDHPPLGKLIIAAFMRGLGDRPLGWRAGALVSGGLTVVLGAVAAARMFRSGRAGWTVAALLAADGFFISYSRAALLDGFLATCAAAALVLWTAPRSKAVAVVAGAMTGAATCIKFSGVGLLPALLLGLHMPPTSRTPLSKSARAVHSVLLTGVAFSTYVAFYAYGLHTARQPATVAAVIRDTVRLVAHHAGLTEMKNPWTSGWVTWALPTRPILLGSTGHMGAVRVLTSLGNLATWWASILLALACAATIGWRGLRRTVADPREAERSQDSGIARDVADRGSPGASIGVEAFVAAHGRAVVTAVAVALGFLAPWVLTHRDSYVYHFLPSYTALVVLLGGYLRWVGLRRPGWVLVFMAVVLVVAAFYAPVWSMTPLRWSGVRWRLFFENWR